MCRTPNGSIWYAMPRTFVAAAMDLEGLTPSVINTSSTPPSPMSRKRTAAASAALLVLLPLLAGAGSREAAGASPRPPSRSAFHLFLLVGQSNMAGRGDVDASDRQPIANVLSLNAAGEWVAAVDPLHWDKPSAGVGLARSFALHYLEKHPGVTVGFVPAAVGGSPIETWEPGRLYEETQTHPYDDALARARRALPDGTLTGILWHQGESDRTPERAPRYEQALTALIARFRKDLGAPDVPFLIGQLGQFAGAPWDAWGRQVDAAQRAVVATVPRTSFVPSHGLSSKPDNLHFDAAALREFGRRYAVAFAELTRPAAAPQHGR